MEKEILVLGGNGKTGRRVAERLGKLGLPVRIGSRNADPAFDWEDRFTWQGALQNVASVYLSFQPDVAVPGAAEIIKNFVSLAAKSGVERIVMLSGRGEVEAQACEKVVMGSGLQFTIVQASWFCQNFSEGNFLDPILSGHVLLPAGNVGEPFVDADDIADVAVAALTSDLHHGQVYDVTGPRLLTFNDAIDEISQITGNNIRYEQVSIESYATLLADYGLPKEIISLITYLFTEVLDGRNARLGDGVARALGRKPTDFSAFVKKAQASNAWNRESLAVT